MSKDRACRKLAVLFNVIAPAKIPVYSGLADNFNLLLLHGGMESNRDSWHNPENQIHNATIKRVWGLQVPLRKMDGNVRDLRHLHINPTFIWYLFRFRPDVIVSNEMGFRTLQALLYGTLTRTPVWVWWGGTPHTERAIGTLRRVMRAVISHWVRHWFSYGDTSTEYLISLEIPKDRIVQIQNGVDETRFGSEAKPEFDLRPRPVLLHVGQLIARKGIDAFLRAAAEVQREGGEFSLLLVGNGPDKQKLEQLVADLKLRNVNFRASLPPEKMPSVYRSADVLIFPTLSDVWGTVANEAVLCGLPVLCSKYAGCAPELFTEDSIFDPEDPAEFVAKLRESIAGHLPKPDVSRIRTTPEIVNRMVSAIQASAPTRVDAVHPVQVRK